MEASKSMTSTRGLLIVPVLALLALPQSGVAEQAALQFEIVDKVNWRAEKAAAVPSSVSETYSYDETTDTVTVVVTFDRPGFAPLPPMLALALRYGFPVQFSPQPQETGSISVLGPLMGYEDSKGYSYKVRGLGKYVLERPKLGSGKAPTELQQELEAQVEGICAAGHLAPWLFLVNVPGSGPDDRGDVYWHMPGETLYLLAEAAPLLPAAKLAQLKEYMKLERQTFPPEQLRSVPFTAGARREPCSPSNDLLKRWEDRVLAYRTKGRPGLWALYGLSRYYEVVGERPSAEVMHACNAIVADGMADRDWATLYWLRGHTPAFNAVHGVNQLFAGCIGYLRLARAAGDRQAEALGWGQLARMAVLRFALGKYTQFMHDNRLFNVDYWLRGYSWGPAAKAETQIKVEADPGKYSIPQDPAWWANKRAGNWIGDLTTWSWTQPLDDVRQVHRLDERGVDVWEWCGVDCGGTGQKRDPAQNDYWYMRLSPCLLPFCDMVSELGRFMCDYLKPESEAFCKRVVENQPHWYATYAEAILSAEMAFNVPADAYGQFKARAWLLQDKPQDLERYVDVPWLQVGDLYHLHKLAETIKAYRGVKWEKASR